MKLLIKNVTVSDLASSVNGQTLDVLLEDGKIAEMGTNLTSDAQETIDEEGLYISPGAFDLIGSIPEPGEEYKESLISGMQAAQNGGFSAIGLVPHNLAPCDSLEKVQYLKNSAKYTGVDIHPIGALTKGLKGENMSELYDMQTQGAVAFAENRTFLKNTEVMKTAVEYSRIFNGTVFSFPYDMSICKGAMVNEGKISVFLGMKGNPSISEAMGIDRDLSIAQYTDGKMHFACISTKESVEKIRQAKAEGLNVTASVAINNLYFTDEHLLGFDQNLKVVPPIRSNEDKEALIEGVLDGTIDCIVSNHHPQDADAKKCEFSIAKNGAIAYQTTIPAAYEVLKDKMSIDEFTNVFTHRAKQTVNMNADAIETGNNANVTLFKLNENYTFTSDRILSKSDNSPYINEAFNWKAYGIYNKKQWTKV